MEPPKAMPLLTGPRSLQSDMIFGWRPKALSCRAPVPLNFHYNKLTHVRDPSTNQRLPVIFHGYRPRDSYQMHKLFAQYQSSYLFNFDHPLISALEFISNQNLQRPDPSGRSFEGNKRGIANLEFDASFQGGNLDKVVYGGGVYYLYMRADSNTRGHFKWFYFRCRNSGEMSLVKFCIVNFKYRSNLLCQGMKPVFRTQNSQWKNLETQIAYKPSVLNTKNSRKGYYQLEFSHSFRSGQEFYFALSEPYLYSDLVRYLKELPPIAVQESLCQSLSGIEVPIVTIGNKDAEKILIIGRVHPSETSGSLVVEGIINFLVSQNIKADTLRKNFEFKIVPMTNPDGVILGNSRTSFSGQDLNRRYNDPDQIIHPVPYHIKQLVRKEGRVFAVFDIHGHFTKKSSFMFGPHFPLHSQKYYTIRILPKLLGKSTSFFRYFSCSFRNEKSRMCAARLVFAKEFKITHSYTVENSLYGYLDGDRKTIKHSSSSYREFGNKLCDSIYYYTSLIKQEKREQKFPSKKQGKKRIKRNSTFSEEKLNEIVEEIKNDPVLSDCQDTDEDSSQDEQIQAQTDLIKAIIEFQGPEAKKSLENSLNKRLVQKKKEKHKLIKKITDSSPFLPEVIQPKIPSQPNRKRARSSKSQMKNPKGGNVSFSTLDYSGFVDRSPRFVQFKIKSPRQIQKSAMRSMRSIPRGFTPFPAKSFYGNMRNLKLGKEETKERMSEQKSSIRENTGQRRLKKVFISSSFIQGRNFQ